MTSPLLALTDAEWENVCDGCGRCCLVKLQDEETEEVAYTNVACEFLLTDNCRCSDYENRATINLLCMVLSRDNLEVMNLMPTTCAYRVIHEGRQIDDSPETLSVSGKVISEKYIHEDQLPDHIVDWIQVNP